MKRVVIYTDGACSGNPGVGGWGAVLIYGEAKKEISGAEKMTTNNRMELTAAIKALELLRELKDSFLHSLFYRAFHTILCLFTNIRVALSCLTRKGSQSGPERH